MNFHYTQQKFAHTLEWHTEKRKGLIFKKEINLDKHRDMSLTHDRVFIGKYFIDHQHFDQEIEDYHVSPLGYSYLLQSSRDAMINGEIIQVRRQPMHRVQIGEQIINYADKTISGQPAELDSNGYYIEEIQMQLVKDKLGTIQLRESYQYKKIRVQMFEDVYILKFITDNEQQSILLKNNQQVPFYQEEYVIVGQLYWMQGYFYVFKNGTLSLYSSKGLEYQENVGEFQGFLDQGKLILIESDQLREQQRGNSAYFTRTIQGLILDLKLIAQKDRIKQLFINNQIKNNMIDNLIQVDDFKFVKQQIKTLTFDQSQLIDLYLRLHDHYNQPKLLVKAKLLKCYKTTQKPSILDCVTQCTNIADFINEFRYHLIYNYVYTLYLIGMHREEFLDRFAPNGALFHGTTLNESGQLSNKNQLTLKGLSQNVPKIKANYAEIYYEVMIKLFGYTRHASKFDNSQSLFLYNLSLKNIRETYEQFLKQDNQINIVLSSDLSLLRSMLMYYQQQHLDSKNMILQQLKTNNSIRIIISLIEQQLMPISIQMIEQVFMYCQGLKNTHYQDLYLLLTALKTLSFPQQQQQRFFDVVSRIELLASISDLLNNFNIVYSISSIEKELSNQQAFHACISQIMQNTFLNRVKSTSYKFRLTQYNTQNVFELKKLLCEAFKGYVELADIETIILKNYMEFGLYKDVFNFIIKFSLSTQDIDKVLCDSMAKYLKQQKNIDQIEEERLKFKEIIVLIERTYKQKLQLTYRQMQIYKYIRLSREIGDYNNMNLQKCNHVLMSLYKRSKNHELAYITMKKKLAKANDVEVYDLEFCKFILEIGQKTLSTNKERAQLIFNELLKQNHALISAQVSIIMAQSHEDAKIRMDHFWKVLKSSTQPEAISNLIQLYPQKVVQFKRKIKIVSTELVNVPISTAQEINEFSDQLQHLYSASQIEQIFLDCLLKEPKEGFELLRLKRYEAYEFIKKICLTNLFKVDKLLTMYLEILTPEKDQKILLQSTGLTQSVSQSLVISRYPKFFSIKSIFDQELFKSELDSLWNMEMESLILELQYFRHIDIQASKKQGIVRQIESINVKDYYLRFQDQGVTVLRTAVDKVKLDLSMFSFEKQFMLQEQKLPLTEKERAMVRAFINQSLFDDNKSPWQTIYNSLIVHQNEFLKDEFREIIQNHNVYILLKIAHQFYDAADQLNSIYIQKLSYTGDQEMIEQWLKLYPNENLVQKIQQECQ